MKNIKFGFIQGRLTKPPKRNMLQYFPKKNWQNEFKIAHKNGFSFIEYFGERNKNINNPIWSTKGQKKIRSLQKKYKLKGYSFCDDFFINNNLLNYKKIDMYFNKIKNNLSSIGIKIYVLALFEKSEIKNKNKQKFEKILKKISNILQTKKIKLVLETNLNCLGLQKLFSKLNDRNIFIVYDTGNRLKNGSVQYDEIIKLKKKIVHVHLKDKNYKGDNVVFGTGNVNLKLIFKALKKIQYKGSFTFETNRGSSPLMTMINNKKLVLKILQQNE